MKKKIKKRSKKKLKKRVKKINLKKRVKRNTFKKKRVSKKRKKAQKRRKINRKRKFKVKVSKIKKIKISKFQRPRINLFQQFSFKKMVGKSVAFFVYPILDFYENYKIKRKKELLLKEKQRIQADREEKKQERERLKLLEKKRISDEIKIQEQLKQDLRKEVTFFKKEELKNRKEYLQKLRLESKLASFEKRMQKEAKELELMAVRELKIDYKTVEIRLEALKNKYRALKTAKVRERLESLLGTTEITATTHQELLQKEQEYINSRNAIYDLMTPFVRNLQSCCFQISRRHLPKSLDILRLDDLIYESGEMWIRHDTSDASAWLLLVYLKEKDNPEQGLYVESRCNPNKHMKKFFEIRSIFDFSDFCVDNLVAHIQKLYEKSKNKEAN